MSHAIPPSISGRLADRALLHIGGPEARDFLNGLVTRNVVQLSPGASLWAGLLSPQGKALFDFLLWADGPEDVLIDCEAVAADALMRRLMLYRLRRPVTIARQETLAVHWSNEAHAGRSDPRMAALGCRWLAALDPAVPDVSEAWRIHRLRLGVTEGQAELGTDQTLWLEANADELHGVDFDKGCYVGQENTARMHFRHKVGRRLVVLPVGMSDPARRRLELPELGLAIDFRRVDDMDGLPLPDWQKAAIAPIGAA